MEKSKLNIKELVVLYKSNPCAKALLDYVAVRRKNSTETTVDRLEVILRQHSAECSRADLIGVLKSMEEIGCGVFIIGRRGQPSRFQWHFKMTEVGKAAQGAQDSVSLVDFEEEEEEEDENEDIVPPPGVIRHTFNLRPDYTLSFELPADFNQREASRLAEFVKTLPFEDD